MLFPLPFPDVCRAGSLTLSSHQMSPSREVSLTTLFKMATPTSHPTKHTSLSQLHFLHNLHSIRYLTDLFIQFILGSLIPH